MAGEVLVEYCAVNVAAHPHPPGVYLSLLNRAASYEVNYWGDQFSRISQPVEREDGIYQGRLVTWTNINRDEPPVDTLRLEELDWSDLNLDIPDNLGFNGRIFYYTFRERDHTMFVEVRNEVGKRVSPRQVERILTHLFSQELQGEGAPLVEVTLIPDEDTLNRIMSIDRLKRLEIHLVRPNADDLDVEEILAELDAQNAKAMDKVLVAVPGSEGLAPDERTKKEAQVAEFNGHVIGSGNETDGELVHLSTKAHPRIFKHLLGDFGGALATALWVAKESVVRRSRGENPI